MGQHAIHAGHLFGFRGVDALDDGMGNLGLGQGQMQGVGRHAVGGVGAEFRHARDLGHGAGPGQARPPDAAVGGHLELDVLQSFFAAHHGRRVHDRVHQRFVAGAAADIVVFLEPVAHVLTAGIGIFIQQPLGRHDKARRAETALGRAVENPGMLQRMQAGGRTDALQSGDGGVFRHTAHFGDAGAHHLAVQNHGTGAALALAATHLDAGQLQLPAQHVNQGVVGVDQQSSGNAIDHKRFCFHVRLLGNVWISVPERPIRPGLHLPKGQTG